jgi:signal transduction histidine kinase
MMDSFLGTPIRVRGVVYGNLYLCDKSDGQEFGVDDVAVLETLALAAGIAISNARLRERVSELSVAEERERIARDLHDTVIQRLYGIGLTLQGVIPAVEGERTKARLQISLDEIDATIRQIRTSIFELEPIVAGPKGFRAQVLELTSEASRVLGFEPEVRFVGPLDTMVDDGLVLHVLAVLRESLSNVARHAHADRVQVEVSLHAGQIAVVVTDDGVGLPKKNLAPGNGLRNLNERASLLAGSCSIETGDGSGTKMVWRVPV